MKVNKRQIELKKRILKRYPNKQEQAFKIGLSTGYYSKFLNDKLELSEEQLDRIEKYLS